MLLAGILAMVAASCGGGPSSAADDGAAAEEPAPPPPPPTFGLDSGTIAEMIAQAAEMPRLRTLLVARHGEILVEQRFRGPRLNQPANVKSVSKSILSALVGIAIEDGHLTGADQPIAPFFDRYLADDDDPRKARISVGNLLSMQSGLQRTSGSFYGAWVTSPDWVAYVLTRPMADEPGGDRLYSTGNSHVLSALLTNATGRSTLTYAREKLAEPLGIDIPGWATDPQGIYFGGNEMRMTPRAMLRFGELYRQGGRYDGQQVVPEWWVDESLKPRSAARRRGEGYGYGWFLGEVRGHPMFYAWGYGGQFIFVVPDLDLTVVTTSEPDGPRDQDNNSAIRRLLAGWIVPAAERGAEMVTGNEIVDIGR